MFRDKIGIIDLQGGVVEHVEHLRRIGVPSVIRIKTPRDITDDLAGLIIPGGESTCLSRLVASSGLDEAIRTLYRDNGVKLWGTCAGAILLAERVVGEEPKLPLLDIEVERNAFGSQLASFQATVEIPEVADGDLPLTFIRAPKILYAGSDVHVLLRQKGYIAMAETEDILVTVFHPELTPCLEFHRYFARKCGLETASPPPGNEVDWNITSWTRQARI